MNLKIRSRSGDANRDSGFTLIELMVVVLIIAILLAIAIPTFLGAQDKSKDRSAQSSLRNSLTAAKTIFADQGKYTDATTTALALVEPAFTFVANTAVSDDPKEVSIETLAATATVPATFFAAAESDTGTCFFIKDVVGAGGGTQFGKGSATSTCSGDGAEAGTGITWKTNGW